MHFVGGQKYNHITLIEENGRDKWLCRTWLCRCICGKEITVRQSDIGRRLSCGCQSMLIHKNREIFKNRVEKSIYSDLDGECFTLPYNTPAVKGYNSNKSYKYWFA